MGVEIFALLCRVAGEREPLLSWRAVGGRPEGARRAYKVGAEVVALRG